MKGQPQNRARTWEVVSRGMNRYYQIANQYTGITLPEKYWWHRDGDTEKAFAERDRRNAAEEVATPQPNAQLSLWSA